MQRNKNLGGKVCLIGATGFLGSTILHRLLELDEYTITATVRNPDDELTMQPIKTICGDRFDDIDWRTVDINNLIAVENAIEGCQYVIHTAAEYPDKNPETKEEQKKVISTAQQGTKNVLEACQKYGVLKLVYTSDLVTLLNFDNYDENKSYNEQDRVNPDDFNLAYPKGKALAEKEVWDCIHEQEQKEENERLEIVILNPARMVGKIMIRKHFTSADIISKIMLGRYPGLPNIYVMMVDVEDVAEAHINALKEGVEPGNYILSNRESIEFVKIGEKIAAQYSSMGYEPSQRKLGWWTAKVASWFVPEAKTMLKQWGKQVKVENGKSIEAFDISYTSIFDRSLINMCRDLIENEYVDDRRPMEE